MAKVIVALLFISLFAGSWTLTGDPPAPDPAPAPAPDPTPVPSPSPAPTPSSTGSTTGVFNGTVPDDTPSDSPGDKKSDWARIVEWGKSLELWALLLFLVGIAACLGFICYACCCFGSKKPDQKYIHMIIKTDTIDKDA